MVPREAPVFGLLDVFFVVLATFFLLIVTQVVAFGVARALPHFAKMTLQQMAKEPLLLVPAQAVAYLFLVAFIHLLLIARYGRGLAEAIPFRRPRHWAALLGAGVALAIAIQLIDSKLPVPKQLPIDDFFKGPTEAWVMLVFGVFIAPFVEELFFRGLLYPVLNRRFKQLFESVLGRIVGSVLLLLAALLGVIFRRHLDMAVFCATLLVVAIFAVVMVARVWNASEAATLGTAFSLIWTSYLFALLHASQLAFSWAPLLSLFLVGFALTLVRARAQSVTASTLVHMAYNATLFGVILAQTGGFRYMDRLAR